ncbi:MAG: HAD family phosphatase [Ectothiorhodospiraceae bacterium]|nr:HAD family phosphatase [Chromatiales bacterium]MCP5155727.1 HAD family phosphatase [Ectothiorhodospiraceae bacterium]
MRPIADMPDAVCRSIRGVLTDIDDTLTDGGRLGAAAYRALERLRDAGLLVIPITGRPGGWCDLIARQWPVDAVVGENGAFYFRYDDRSRRMIRRFVDDPAALAARRARLDALAETILAAVPGAAISADQRYRHVDLAVDWCEDVERLGRADVERIVALFEAAGATAKVSSIHVNGWFGAHDKLTTTRTLLAEVFDIDLAAERDHLVFVGDSPNDAPMFGHFPNAVGVANVVELADAMPHRPAWVTRARGGAGFAEVAERLLSVR